MFEETLKQVSPRDGDGKVTVFVETPKGSGHKYDLDHATGLFRWGIEMPSGVHFPCSFGFVPNTLAEDGDPLDIALMSGSAVPNGVLVASRLVGVIELEQEEDGTFVRNDRIVAVADLSRTFAEVEEMADMGEAAIWDLKEFFATYNRAIGREVRFLGEGDAGEARRLFEEAIERAGS